MRAFLAILSVPTGAMSLVMLAAAFTKGGSDIQIIGSGVFMMVFAVSLGCVGIMTRIEELREMTRKERT